MFERCLAVGKDIDLSIVRVLLQKLNKCFVDCNKFCIYNLYLLAKVKVACLFVYLLFNVAEACSYLFSFLRSIRID